MNNNLIAELLERAEAMLTLLDQEIEHLDADGMAYPNMQNLCLLMQTIAQLRQAYGLLAVDQDLQYIMRQLDGFRVNGFPVRDISLEGSK